MAFPSTSSGYDNRVTVSSSAALSRRECNSMNAWPRPSPESGFLITQTLFSGTSVSWEKTRITLDSLVIASKPRSTNAEHANITQRNKNCIFFCGKNFKNLWDNRGRHCRIHCKFACHVFPSITWYACRISENWPLACKKQMSECSRSKDQCNIDNKWVASYIQRWFTTCRQSRSRINPAKHFADRDRLLTSPPWSAILSWWRNFVHWWPKRFRKSGG